MHIINLYTTIQIEIQNQHKNNLEMMVELEWTILLVIYKNWKHSVSLICKNILEVWAASSLPWKSFNTGLRMEEAKSREMWKFQCYWDTHPTC